MRAPRSPDQHPAQQWAAAVATALDEITAQVEGAARRLAEGWPDARGREWTDRLVVLHQTLRRHADSVAELGRAIGRAADDQALDSGGASLPYGPLLGGTGARHVDDRRGVTIPQLNDDSG